jgi:protein-disulfide isomerase
MGHIHLTASDHAVGNPDTADITLVEYGDYQCPYTAKAVPLVERAQERFGGALRYAFRNFPLVDIHPRALRAALAAEAAALQGRFWEMHLTLFRHQRQLGDEDLLHYAAGLRLQLERFARDLDSPETAERVRHDRASGERLRVHGTPTFFINDRRYEASVDETLLAAIEEAIPEVTSPGS